jgi:hypothetical protein
VSGRRGWADGEEKEEMDLGEGEGRSGIGNYGRELSWRVESAEVEIEIG